MGTIYAPRQYYERIMRFSRNLTFEERRIADINLSSFAHLIQIDVPSWNNGKERVYYWRLFLVAVQAPQVFPKAIAYAIYGYHFRKVFEPRFNLNEKHQSGNEHILQHRMHNNALMHCGNNIALFYKLLALLLTRKTIYNIILL